MPLEDLKRYVDDQREVFAIININDLMGAVDPEDQEIVAFCEINEKHADKKGNFAIRTLRRLLGLPYRAETRVSEKYWGPDDTYLNIGMQVFSSDGFRPGDKVLVTVEKIE